MSSSIRARSFPSEPGPNAAPCARRHCGNDSARPICWAIHGETDVAAETAAVCLRHRIVPMLNRPEHTPRPQRQIPQRVAYADTATATREPRTRRSPRPHGAFDVFSQPAQQHHVSAVYVVKKGQQTIARTTACHTPARYAGAGRADPHGGGGHRHRSNTYTSAPIRGPARRLSCTDPAARATRHLPVRNTEIRRAAQIVLIPDTTTRPVNFTISNDGAICRPLS